MWMNEYEIDQALAVWGQRQDETPHLAKAAKVLFELALWVNNNSDGWPYWKKPAAAARRLMEAIARANDQWRQGREVDDLSATELTNVLKPIKAFLTRHDVPRNEIPALVH